MNIIPTKIEIAATCISAESYFYSLALQFIRENLKTSSSFYLSVPQYPGNFLKFLGHLKILPNSFTTNAFKVKILHLSWQCLHCYQWILIPLCINGIQSISHAQNVFQFRPKCKIRLVVAFQVSALWQFWLKYRLIFG